MLHSTLVPQLASFWGWLTFDTRCGNLGGLILDACAMIESVVQGQLQISVLHTAADRPHLPCCQIYSSFYCKVVDGCFLNIKGKACKHK